MGVAFRQRVSFQLLAFALSSVLCPGEVTLRIERAPSNLFDPHVAFGAGIDGHEEGEIAEKLTPANIQRMLGAGLKPLAYRLRTELAGDAWHWTSRGRWSDAAQQQGYWTGDSLATQPDINVSYGYRLPRRGNTIDQAGNEGYSRIVDGDSSTFWKSNPYLKDRPQWVAVDLGRVRRIDMVRISWGEPHASRFHFDVAEAQFADPALGRNWTPFRNGEEVEARWVRITLEESAYAGPLTSDWRDRTGFAIAELSVGLAGSDYVRHGTSRGKQSVVWVSSTDPWHRATDKDITVEQPGFDFVYKSGLTNGLPVLMPIPVLYDTPENAAALLEYLAGKGYPVTDVELGEEPEEQFVAAEDFAALAHEVVHAVHRKYRFGGPSLILLQPNLKTDAQWIQRFYRAFPEIGFLSFEWYPFDDVCGDVGSQLARSAELLRGSLQKLALPKSVPVYMTEYGYSAYGAQAEIDLPGAILNAEAVALFMTEGGARTYLYGYEPGDLLHDKACTWGNNMMFLDERPTATYWAAKLLTGFWASPSGGFHSAYRVATGSMKIGAYAVRRPSGEFSILVVNRSASEADNLQSPFVGEYTAAQFSGSQYKWHSAGKNGHVTRSVAPAQFRSSGSLALPPYSITVITGRLPENQID